MNVLRSFLARAIAALSLAAAAAAPALAAPQININAPGGLFNAFGKEYAYALDGYDTTSYFDGAPVRGSDAFSSAYQGATWLFASAENKAKFDADPARFAPQYGAYCAWRLADDGTLVPGDPEVWAVVDGKLYLNFNRSIQRKWDQDRAGFIDTADGLWPAALTSPQNS